MDKLLFTPGPLNTSRTVKEAALADLGSRDTFFISIVGEIRKKLLSLAGVEAPAYEAVIIQGSGTFGIESVISSAIPDSGLLLNIVNGAYGRRITTIAKIHGIDVIELVCTEDLLPDQNELISLLKKNKGITHVALVHGETTTGLLNPLSEIAKIVKSFDKCFIVDAMSTFGAYKINPRESSIGFLISSSNKCIEGIPGFSFVIAKREELEKCKDNSRTLSLDLYDQWNGLNSNGQFRFTPPVQSLMAFHQALTELEEEGGISIRGMRYFHNNKLLVSGMRGLGFKLFLTDDVRSYIITSFHYPEYSDFSFDLFYRKLSDRGFVIYPGKLGDVKCFRIGNIGKIFPKDIENLVNAIGDILDEMDIELD
jgi:2-aminoethylphosphonate-pyruvate transaminase